MIQDTTAELLMTDPGAIYGRSVIAHVPRLLGQIDRNPHSPTYGSCCRNYWHYRIEDISNSQLQEVVLALALVYQAQSDWNPYAGSPQLLRWIEAILRYWTTLQRPTGSFDEVYQGQDSYAATAFTSYCASEATLVLRGSLDSKLVDEVTVVLDRAVSWLNKTEEKMACNQVAGAAAAMVNAYRLGGDESHRKAARKTLDMLKSLQTDEGWFGEYGGADIGYSSLTLDYLIKIWRTAGWEDAREMGERLLEFLCYFVHRDGTGGGIHGSRNTEYIIPHGIEILAPDNPTARSVCNLLLAAIYQQPDRAVVNRLDDRYLCYLSGFYMQAAGAAVARTEIEVDLPCTKPHHRYFPSSGLWSVGTDQYHLVANVAKGGVFRCDYHDGNSFVDGGLFVTRSDGKMFTSQSLQTGTEARVTADSAEIEAPLVRLKHIMVSPWRVLMFKGYNLAVPRFLRRMVLDLIRKRAVSSGEPLTHVNRTIEAGGEQVRIKDVVRLPEGSYLVRIALLLERAFSFASSGFFHPAEMEQKSSLPVEKQVEGPAELQLERTLTGEGWQVTDS